MIELSNMNLLFDFDGTLVNSFNRVVEKIILLADEFNFRKIQDHEIEGLRKLSSIEIIKFLKIPYYQIPILIHHMRKHLSNEMKGLPPVSQIFPVLKTFYDGNVFMGILSSNSIENISKWLDFNQMGHFFKFIHNEPNFFSKKYLLKKTIKDYQLDKRMTYYIGDETRDIDAANQNKVKSIAVTWGYHSEKILLQSRPSFIARNPDDLLKLCKLTHECINVKITNGYKGLKNQVNN